MDNNVNWRQETISIPAGTQYEYVFRDTMPNQCFIQNLGNTVLYIGISHFPTETKFEFKCEAMAGVVVGRPINFSRLYFYNPLAQEIEVVLTSSNGAFSMDLLKNYNVNLTGDLASQIKFDGVITGFSAPLPSGSNLIGGVNVEDLPPLPVGVNHIGAVAVDDLPSIPAGSNLIGKIEVVPQTGYFYRESSVGVGGSDTQIFTFKEINFVSNDGTENLTITIKKSDGTTGQAITLKANEALSNIKLSGQSYTINSANGTSYRILLLS